MIRAQSVQKDLKEMLRTLVLVALNARMDGLPHLPRVQRVICAQLDSAVMPAQSV
jgi:hypothetical protein